MDLERKAFCFFAFAFCFFAFAFLFFSCVQSGDRGEALARRHCGSCHAFPEPGLLPKSAWKNSVLPEMAFRMGFPDVAIQSRLPPADMDAVLSAIPVSAIITAEEFESISNYYLKNAPDSLAIPEPGISLLKGFDIMPVGALRGQLVTALKYDPVKGNLFVGMRTGRLYKLDKDLEIADSVLIGSAVSDIKVLQDEILVSAMGIMDPSEQAKGKIVSLDLALDEARVIQDSLQRPVFFAKADLNGDDRADFVVCNFGHYTGNLMILRGRDDGSYRRQYVSRVPGARKAVINDFNGDGLPDMLVLMAQGDERLVMYYNEGGFKFSEETVIRFPPVYGISDMQAVDFNGDGFLDIVLTNGDNADYSVLHKPYHGVRVFENDGENAFREVWSVSMPGASQCRAHDFDNDGDMDIAAISFFPINGGSFSLFENMGNYRFLSRSLAAANAGRWLVMETGDFDKDLDHDIFLGAFNYNGLGGRQLQMDNYTLKETVSVLVLENTAVF